MIEFYSRCIVGCRVFARESGELAKEFMAEVFATDRIQPVAHTDRGTLMTPKLLASLPVALDVHKSHPRIGIPLPRAGIA